MLVPHPYGTNFGAVQRSGVEVSGLLQPVFVWVVGEHHLSVFDGVDDLTAHVWVECRAAMASACLSMPPDVGIICISGLVEDDGPVSGIVVKTGLKTIHSKALAVSTSVGLLGNQ